MDIYKTIMTEVCLRSVKLTDPDTIKHEQPRNIIAECTHNK